MPDSRPFQPGDRVRVRGTPATLAAELAGCLGEVRREVSPVPADVEVVGNLQGDVVVEVAFEELGRACWLPPYLLEEPG